MTAFPTGVPTTRADVISCRATDQLRIIIYALSYSDRPIDLCAIAEAATITAGEALKHNGGIAYNPDRTSIYSHATRDACTTLDPATLDQVPHLDRNNLVPRSANWICGWGTTDDGGTHVALHLRSENPGTLDFYQDELVHTEIDGKDAFIDKTEEGLCKIDVVRRSIGTAVEILEIHVEAPLPIEPLCGQATQLATAAEQKLPG